MRLFDIIFSFILILLFSPIMLIIMILIIFFIEFPPFYSANRIGKNNRTFRHIKFKSMKSGPEFGRVFFEINRINWFGRFIRRYHLDELPELLLILAGKMSFVGPRALPKERLEGLDCNKRNTVKPGLACLAQIYLMKNGQLNKKLQIRLDNYYIDNKSFKYNMRIILATIKYLTKSRAINTNQNLNQDRKKFQETNFFT